MSKDRDTETNEIPQFTLATTSEILAHYAELKEGDLCGFSAEVLIQYLPFVLAKQFLKSGERSSDWATQPLDRSDIMVDFKDYIEFAWGKARDHRGISASRSITKSLAWLYILGDTEGRAKLRACKFENYGAPGLLYISKRYGFQIPEDPAVLRMAASLPCRDDCDEGCGK